MKKEPFGDVRDTTFASRKDIGFKGRKSWKTAAARLSKHSLTIEGHPVMEDWEDGYMSTLASIATSNGGVVLEIGYGMGISAKYIQKFGTDLHIIIEANHEVYTFLDKFAKKYKSVQPIFGFWEEVTSSLPEGSIDGILFDTYPMKSDEVHENHFPFFKEAFRLLRSGGILTYYSDEIDCFSENHLKALKKAGFSRIEKFICDVAPPPDCVYWKSSTILAPIVQK
jgi:guanidinoacetate N-methyltransferase